MRSFALSWLYGNNKTHKLINMKHIDRQILNIALPSIVSNITVPLLGLVDVAIVGHMGDAVYIGAIAVGSMIFNVIYWIFGFLRMGTSGMTSQSFGRRDLPEVVRLLLRSLAVGLAVAVMIILFRRPLLSLALAVVSPSPDIAAYVRIYFGICVWGAPAMLCLYGMTGWFIGMQNTRIPMFISIMQNVVNIVASLSLVYACGMKVDGVALGTLIAQYAGLFAALVFLIIGYRRLRNHYSSSGLFAFQAMRSFFSVNRDIFIRTLFIVAVNLFFLSAGASHGTVVLAVNTLLMQLFTLFSYVMDGFAYAGEALCGRYYGARNVQMFRSTVRRLFMWGVILAAVYTVVYMSGGSAFLSLLTDDSTVIASSAAYFPWAVAIPAAGMAAFVWDGVFIGVTATRGMMLSSIFAALLFFVIYMSLRAVWGNHALWFAFIVYLASRGIVQTLLFKGIKKRMPSLLSEKTSH